MKEFCCLRILHKGLVARDGTVLALPLGSTEAGAALGVDSAHSLSAPVVVAGECSSTFDVAWELAQDTEFPPWSAVLALSQTCGRGQVRREWISPPGNLYVSFFMPSEISDLGNLAPLATGYMVHAALLSMGIPSRLKWPNDLLLYNGIDEGKFGGLLLEERDNRLVAGLGLNLRSAPKEAAMRLGNAVPAAALTSFKGGVFPFWLDLVTGMRTVYAESIANVTSEGVRLKVEENLAWKGRLVRAGDCGVFGELVGLAEDGTLLLQTRYGIESVCSGSLSLV